MNYLFNLIIIPPIVKFLKNWDFWRKLGAMFKLAVISSLQGNLWVLGCHWPKIKPSLTPSLGVKTTYGG